MTRVRGVTSKSTSPMYWYWTTLGHEIINLANREVELPKGVYNLFWEIRGSPGQLLEFELETLTGVLKTISDHIPAGSVDKKDVSTFVVP